MSHSPPDLKVGIDTDVIDNEKGAIKVSGSASDATDLGKEHARILRKVDWHLLPLVWLLYLLSFLDRTNIGNARIAGMSKDLDLVGLRYNTAAAIFFIPYVLGQVPSNVFLKRFRPSRWIPGLMVAWGLIMTLMCLVRSYHELLVARSFLGVAESGIYPGVTYYVSSWYPRAERAKRIAIFSSASTIAGAFGGLLAYSIEKMDGIGGLSGWRWIFCLEGIVTVLVALAAPLFMHDYPETASFLTETERNYVVELMKADSQGLATHYSFQFVLQAMKDYKTYLLFGITIGFTFPAYAIALFTPTIVNELGFSASNAQLLSVPPFAAGCVAIIIIGIYSDKLRLRGPFIVGGSLLGIVGCAMLYTQRKPGAALVGVVIAAVGIFPSIPVTFAWVSSNAGGDVKRAVAIAMVSGLGNLGGICSSFLFFDPPRFHVGLGVSMGSMGFSMVLTLFSMWDYDRMNKEKERVCRERGITDEDEDQFRENGDDSPLFRYTL